MRKRNRQWYELPPDIMPPQPAGAPEITAKEFHALMERKAKREAELRPLMDKYDAARKAGLDINERDKSRLLALLLDSVLDGTLGYRN